MSHTAGSWDFYVSDEGELKIDISNGHTVILGDLEGTCPECFANGRLMAAAPELYAALRGEHGDRLNVLRTLFNSIPVNVLPEGVDWDAWNMHLNELEQFFQDAHAALEKAELK